MAGKGRFGLEYNQHGRVVDPGVFNKTIILLAGYKMIIINASAIFQIISSAPS